MLTLKTMRWIVQWSKLAHKCFAERRFNKRLQLTGSLNKIIIIIIIF